MFDFEAQESNSQIQGSKAWHELRRASIGASDVMTIFDMNPYQTKQKLWEVKCGIAQEDKGGWAADRGKSAEPVIRALYESKKGCELTSKVVTYKAWPVMIASLDGFNDDRVVEFKYPGKEKFELAKSGKVPPDHMLQIQAQMLCADVLFADYVSFNGEEIAIVEVPANEVLQKEIVFKCIEFWDNVQKRIPIVAEYNDNELIETLSKRDQLKKQVDAIEKDIAAIDEKLKIDLENYTGKKIGNFSVSWVDKKGNVSYKDVPELQGVDLERYRGKNSRYLKIGAIK